MTWAAGMTTDEIRAAESRDRQPGEQWHTVFETDTTLDLTAFTTFGISAKPNSQSPIGYFGTGLKYAVAVLCRLGLEIEVFIDGVEYVFYAKPVDFRGTTFQQLAMKKRRGLLPWRYETLPYTTELGKNWEVWQAFRELYSNTVDEGGRVYCTTDALFVDQKRAGRRPFTQVVVKDAPAGPPVFQMAFSGKDDIFLPEGLRQIGSDAQPCQRIDRPSKYLYYRGMRVMELPKPSRYTWNVLASLELTEDRTVKYPFMAEWHVACHIVHGTDTQLMGRVLSAAATEWESLLDLAMADLRPTKEFVQLAALRGRGRIGTYWSARSGDYIPTGVVLSWRRRLVLAIEDSDWTEVRDIVSNHRAPLIALLNEDAASLESEIKAGRGEPT